MGIATLSTRYDIFFSSTVWEYRSLGNDGLVLLSLRIKALISWLRYSFDWIFVFVCLLVCLSACLCTALLCIQFYFSEELITPSRRPSSRRYTEELAVVRAVFWKHSELTKKPIWITFGTAILTNHSQEYYIILLYVYCLVFVAVSCFLLWRRYLRCLCVRFGIRLAWLAYSAESTRKNRIEFRRSRFRLFSTVFVFSYQAIIIAVAILGFGISGTRSYYYVGPRSWTLTLLTGKAPAASQLKNALTESYWWSWKSS